MKDIFKLLSKKWIKAEVSQKLKKHLAWVWFDRDFWARPLKRIITNKLVNYLSNKIISWELIEWDKIFLDIDDNKNIFYTKKAA